MNEVILKWEREVFKFKAKDKKEPVDFGKQEWHDQSYTVLDVLNIQQTKETSKSVPQN